MPKVNERVIYWFNLLFVIGYGLMVTGIMLETFESNWGYTYSILVLPGAVVFLAAIIPLIRLPVPIDDLNNEKVKITTKQIKITLIFSLVFYILSFLLTFLGSTFQFVLDTSMKIIWFKYLILPGFGFAIATMIQILIYQRSYNEFYRRLRKATD